MVDSSTHDRLVDLNGVRLSVEIGSHHAEILSWGYIGPEYWRNYLHTHSCFEVCYAFAGNGVFCIADREYVVRSGDLFVARPGKVHEIVSSTDDPLGICFWAYTLTPTREHWPAPVGADALLTAFVSTGSWVSNRSADVPVILGLLEREISGREVGYVELIEALTRKLLLDTCRAVVETRIPAEHVSFVRPTPAQRTTDQIIRYLSDNLSRPVTVRDVAAQVHLSERHTNRLFREVHGVSIMDYLTSLRMHAASHLLLARELPIKEVAREVGYADVHYFTTLFHRRMGIPPAAFRAQDGTQLVQTVSASPIP